MLFSASLLWRAMNVQAVAGRLGCPALSFPAPQFFMGEMAGSVQFSATATEQNCYGVAFLPIRRNTLGGDIPIILLSVNIALAFTKATQKILLLGSCCLAGMFALDRESCLPLTV